MTNANLPERWLNDMRFRRKRLPDSAFRSYALALMWSVANRTDGIIERGDVEDIPDFSPADIPDLMRVGLWDSRGPDRGWLIHDFDTTQTGKDLLEKYEREKAADRKRKAEARREAAEAKRAAEEMSTGKSTGQRPPESPSTNQTRPVQGAEGDDGWFTADERSRMERERLEWLADRNTREGYEQ